MPKKPAFDQFFMRLRLHIFALFAALLVSACATTSPQQPSAPVTQRPAPAGPQQGEAEQAPVIEAESEGQEESIDVPEASEDVAENDLPDLSREGPYFNNRSGLTPPHMKGRDTKRLALLLPFSAKSSRLRDEASSMYRAAELSVFERGDNDVLLIALDTKGTTSGARSAARAAMNAGADVILGPIIAKNVRAAAREVKSSGTPLLAFSNDQAVAGDGTYLLSFPPEAEVERVVDYVASTGATRFAFMGPKNAYGRRVQQAYDAAIKSKGGQITALETYDGNDISVMQEPAQRLAQYHAEGERAARESNGLTPMSFEAILLPEGGNALRSLAPLLPYYDIDPADVQFMGTSRWASEDTVREPALAGGIFAGPDKDARENFSQNYDRVYGEEASALASLAYDAVMVGAFIADGDPKNKRYRAEDPKGFYGVDGLVSFESDGRPQRGLAVYTIRNGRFIVLDPAPRSTGGGS